MGPREGLAGKIRQAVEDAVGDAAGATHVAAATHEGGDGAVVSATSHQHVAIVQHRGRTWVNRGPSAESADAGDEGGGSAGK